jgi:hypothetical protein
MTLALLLIGATVALTAVFAAATQVEETVNPVLAPDDASLSDSASDTLAARHAATPAPAGDWQLRTLGSLSEAEILLDCLEARGVAERELVILGQSSFAVRWR